MWLTIRRRRPRPIKPELIEVVTPRTNAAAITAMENLLAGLALGEPVSLEIAGTNRARWLLARTSDPVARDQLADRFAAAYPLADLRQLDLDSHPSLDPALVGADEQVSTGVLQLRGPGYLPLRAFSDDDLDGRISAQADPILGILGALGSLPDGWRALAQLVLHPAPENWNKGYVRLALENPLERERAREAARYRAAETETTGPGIGLIVAFLVLVIIGLQAYSWYRDENWWALRLLAGGIVFGIPLFLWLVWWIKRRLFPPPVLYDPRLVQEKLSRFAYRAELRLSIIAPPDASRGQIRGCLEQLAGAYRLFTLPAGNALVLRQVNLGSRDLRSLAPLVSRRSLPILNIHELASLWHLPLARDEVPFLERTTARQRLPLPSTVALGCRIGVSAGRGRETPICLPDDLLQRHLLLVAKTRRGKSSLLLRIAKYLINETGFDHPALVLVDPHRDLAEAALGLIPRSRWRDVIYLNAAEEEQPFGLNLLDVGLGWSRDKAVANALAIFRREFSGFWGPRMEDAFRFGLLTLYEANEAYCRASPGVTGREQQHTILDVPTVLLDRDFRASLLELVRDPMIPRWWAQFDRLDRHLQIESVNPVQTKVQRFAGSYAARNIVGQPRSTINPADWLRSGKIVIVDAAKGVVGEDTAGLLGGTLINLVELVVGEQARLPSQERRRVVVLVDEMQAAPGANYEALLSESAKYGASLVLATQSLARLDVLDREHERALRPTVFANIDGLFAFNVSAEDARYLARELAGDVDEADLVTLGEHQCYAKITAGGEYLPTFSVQLDPPPQSDPNAAVRLAATATVVSGRPRDEVEASLRAALARVALTHGRSLGEGTATQGTSSNERTDASASQDTARKPRNQHRASNPSRSEPYRPTLSERTNPASQNQSGLHPREGGEQC